MSFTAVLTQQQQKGIALSDPLEGEATYSVQVDWTPASAAFRIGVSTLDSGDVLSGGYIEPGWDGTYDDVTDEVRSFTIERGRDNAIDAMQTGTAEIVLPDPTGKYNPRSTSSVLSGSLVPRRQVRIRATQNGVTYHLFRGFIESIEFSPNREDPHAVIYCQDAFTIMAEASPIISSTGTTTTGAAIQLILTTVGLANASLNSIDVGDTIDDFSADGSESALTLVENLLTAERGLFWVAADGTITYEDRHQRSQKTSAATLTGASRDFLTGTDVTRVINRARVTRTGGVQQTATDGNSIAAYQLRDNGDIETPYVQTDTQAAALADYIVQLRKDPRAPVWDMPLGNKDGFTLRECLRRDISDRIGVVESRAGVDADHYIEGVMHHVHEGGKVHDTDWRLSERTSGSEPFIIGVSTIGGDDVIAY